MVDPRDARDVRTENRLNRADARNPDQQPRRSLMPWVVGVLVIAALVVGGFFLLGGDVDTDTEGEFNVDVPNADVDVQGPDVSVETPDVDIDPGSVDVEGGEADADASDG